MNTMQNKNHNKHISHSRKTNWFLNVKHERLNLTTQLELRKLWVVQGSPGGII